MLAWADGGVDGVQYETRDGVVVSGEASQEMMSLVGLFRFPLTAGSSVFSLE